MADWTDPPWAQLVAGKPWSDEKAAAAFENSIAIAEGAPDAPRVQGVALGGVSVGSVAFFGSEFGAITGLDRAELIVGYVYAYVSSGSASLSIRFSANNGISYGAPLFVASGVSGSVAAILRVNLRTGASRMCGVSSSGAIDSSTVSTVPDGANAIGLSGSGAGDWVADFYCLGGRP